MPLFQYQALDIKGRKHRGVIEAQSDREAKERLRERGLMVSQISSKATTSSKQNLSGEHLVAFTLQLSLLVNAGVPLFESLTAIEEQYRHESFHRVILSLCDQIKGGTSLSDAMRTYPESFDRLYCAMVAAGEAAGALGMVLERLTQLLTRQMKLKKEITTALIYPCILASFSLLVIALLLGFVVPSIEGIFSGRQLNGFTRSVLAISHFFRENWLIYIPITAGLITWLVIKLRSPKGKIWLERNLIKVPLIRNLIIQASVARFTRTLATLQQGGLTLIESLRMSTEVIRNVAIEEEMKVAEAKIIEGSSLSIQLSRSRYIPAMVARMIAIGEDAGSTVVMLDKIADMYEESVEKSLSQILALVQPVILIFMGGVIGLVMMAILLPLTDLASFSGGS